MKVIVQKFGGSSVANVERIKNVAKRVVAYRRRGWSLVVVVSALGDTTDELVELAHGITREPPAREVDSNLLGQRPVPSGDGDRRAGAGTAGSRLTDPALEDAQPHVVGRDDLEETDVHASGPGDEKGTVRHRGEAPRHERLVSNPRGHVGRTSIDPVRPPAVNPERTSDGRSFRTHPPD